MKNERIKILELLAEETIDTDEAVRLLKALDSDEDNADEIIQQFAENSERFAEDFSERFHAAFKDIEPELDAAAKEVLGAVASLLDDVSQSLKDKNNKPYDKDTHGGD